MSRHESAVFLLDAVRGSGATRAEALRVVRLMCRTLGGNDVYVGDYESERGATKALLGCFADAVSGDWEAVARRFFEMYGSMSYYIPKELAPFRKDIALEIVEARKAGATMIELTHRYGLTSRSVNNLYNFGLRVRQEARQRKLF